MSSPAAPSSSRGPWPGVTTDPGLDAVESLYRGGSGRSGVRFFEPALRPPEGTSDHSWLFRPDDAALAPIAVIATTGGGGPSDLTSTGPAVLGPTALLRWAPPTRVAGPRWRAAALLAVALGCALLLPWVVRTT